MTSSQRRALLISICLSIVGYGAWIVLTETDAIVASIKRLSPAVIIGVFALSLLNYALRFVRYHGYMKYLGDHVPIRKNILYYLAGFALTTTPGKAGESIRALYLHKHKVPVEHSFAVLFVERIQDLVAVLFLAMLALISLPQFHWILWTGLGLITTLLIIIQVRSFPHYLERLGQARGGWLLKVSQFTSMLFKRSQKLLEFRPLLAGLIIGLLAWSAEAYGFILLIKDLGYDSPALFLAGIYAAAMLVGAISFLPGGLGSAEATMTLLLLGIGITHADSVSATLICRIATLWFAVFIGVAVMTYLESKQNVPSAE
ncbi:MAG: lysylphosphatidylglycerol synthase transmembrane domain-containing protein [Pseudomonadota bacterium]